MAIQMRRGNYADFDITRLVGGEIAVTDSPNKVFVKTNGGSNIELATKDDLDNVITNIGAVRVENERLIFSSEGS